MENNPLISVIMCVYNTKKEYFYAAVKSILNQTFIDFELIIVNDGSSLVYNDFPFNDDRIKRINSSINQGISRSRNIGLNIAKGKYIAIMDSDDIACPTRLEKEFIFLETNPDVVVCGSWFQFFGDKNHKVKRIIDDNEYYRASLLFGNNPTLLDPSTMIRKSAIDKIGFKYEESLKLGMDYLMWIKLSEIGKVYNYPEVLMHYRVHSNQITRTKEYIANRKNFFFLKYQLERIGCNLAEEDALLVLHCLTTKKIDLLRFIKILDTIKKDNAKSKFLNQVKLEKRCQEEIKRVILVNKNVLWILKYLFNHKTFKIVISTEFNRIFRKK